MIIVLSCYSIIFVAIKLMWRSTATDVIGIVIPIVACYVVSDIWLMVTRESIREELKTKFPQKQFKQDYMIDSELLLDLKLLVYGIVYDLLIILWSYVIFNVQYLGKNVVIIVIPVILNLIYDVAFYGYCRKMAQNTGRVMGVFLYNEARFANLLTLFVMVIIGFLMCIPLLLIVLVFNVIEWFL